MSALAKAIFEAGTEDDVEEAVVLLIIVSLS
jgi:hypothetical protein